LLVLLGLLIFDVTRRGIYNREMGLNIAVVGSDGVSIMLLRPEEEMLGWVKIPGNTRIKIFNSDARYPLNSMWKYGVSEKNPFDILERSLGQAMGVIVSRTVKIDDSNNIENVLGKLYSVGLKTDLSIRDRFMIRQFLTDAVKSKKVLEMTVPDTVFDKVTDPDGAEFREINQSMSLWTKNKFVVEPILTENADISINNISGISGLGNLLANQLESSGMHVIEVKAVPEEIVTGKDCVYSGDKRFAMTELILTEQIGCKKISTPDFAENDDKLRIWIK